MKPTTTIIDAFHEYILFNVVIHAIKKIESISLRLEHIHTYIFSKNINGKKCLCLYNTFLLLFIKKEMKTSMEILY